MPPDPTLIAQRRACTLDDQCPCGSGCELGECVAACTSNKDCGQGTCDRFGRCRAQGDTGLLSAVKPKEGTALRVVSAGLTFSDMNEERPIQFVVDRGEGPVRVAGSEQVEVRCEEGAPYARSCTFGQLAAGSSATVWARPAQSAAGSALRRAGSQELWRA